MLHPIQICVIVSLVLHGVNAFMIIQKRNLHNVRYVLLFNLIVSDILYAVTTVVYRILKRHYVALCIMRTFYFLSILSTFVISLDRYVAIKYCLRYPSLASKQNLIKAIVMTWLLATCIGTTPLIYRMFKKKSKGHIVLQEWLLYLTVFSVCFFLVLISLYTINIRKKHMRVIKKQRKSFEKRSEHLNSLQLLGNSVKDVFRLNLATVVLLVTQNLVRIFGSHLDMPVTDAVKYFAMIYLVGNPLIYATTMAELRKHYKKLFTCSNKDPTSHADVMGHTTCSENVM